MTNQGLILGLGKELHSTIWYGVAMNAFALTGMILGYVYYCKEGIRNSYIAFVFAFGIAGELGNIYDRIFLGYVRDFITWFGPGAFNLADLWGWVALVLFAFLLIRSKFDFSMIGKTL